MSMVDELNIQISADVGGASASISGVAQSLEDLGGSADNAKGGMSDFVAVMSGIAQQMQQFTATIAQAVSGLTSFGGSTADLDRFAAASERASTSLTSMSDAAIYTSPRIGMMGTAAEQTRSELQGMQQGLQGALGDIKSFSDDLGKAGRDAADAAAQIKKLSEEIPKLKSAPVTTLEAAFKKLKGTVATLGIGKFLKDSNDAYVVQMQNELKLTAHMKHRMNATDEEIQSIKDLASAQQKIGVIGDEIQLAGAQQLTTYAKQASTLKTLIPAMNDLIAQNAGYEASVGDATSAADMLGRALNGQYTALKRQGVMFTEAQEQILKYGTESQKAQVLVDAIGDKVGNMNELLANTPTGKLKQLQNDFGDLREQLGATFQPLISSILPILRGAMDMLAEPILNVSRGISIIGQAIASIDSPAVRGIALAAAGIAVLHKLRAAIGGPLTLLLTLGVTLAGLVGSTAEQTDDIGAIVKSAYDGATNATDGATDAAKDYEEELGNVQKAVSKLAGFDTITKLSGGSGALANALISDNDLSKLYEATDAMKVFKSEYSTIDAPKLDFGDIGYNIMEKLFGKDYADNWRTGWNTLSTWWNNDFLPNWQTGWDTLCRGWDAFWANWQTGMDSVDREVGYVHENIDRLVSDAWFLPEEMRNNAKANVIARERYGKFLAQLDSFTQKQITDEVLGIEPPDTSELEQKKLHEGNRLQTLYENLKYLPDYDPYYKLPTIDIDKGMIIDSTGNLGLDIALIQHQKSTMDFPSPTVEKNNNYTTPATRSTADVPSEARGYINVEVKNYINDEKVNSDYTTRTNG